MVTSADLLPVLPELTLALTGMALLMFGVFRGENSGRTVSWLAVLALIVVGLLMSFFPSESPTAFGGQFVIDQFARFMKWLVLIGSVLAIVMSLNYNEREGICGSSSRSLSCSRRSA